MKVYQFLSLKEMYTFTNIKTKLPSILIEILNSLQECEAKPILVGGCIRDFFLKIDSKDFDIEIFNVEKLEDIQDILSKYGNVKLVGKSFGVLTLSVDGFDFDFALAREEKRLHLDTKVLK